MRETAAALILALGLGCAAGPAGAQAGSGGEIVVAQAQQRESPSIFRFLRREPRGVVVIDPPPGATTRPRSGTRSRPERSRKAEPRNRSGKSKAVSRQKQQRPAKKRARTAAPARKKAAAPAPVVVEKAPDAQRVLVVGDFMAGALAKGLVDAYAENANIVVADASNGASGLVRTDHFNWAGEIQAIVEKEQPAAILVLIGSNDRQALDTPAGSVGVGAEGWNRAYGERVSAFTAALKATGKPVLWGSLVPVRPAAMSRDYSAMNTVFREALDGTGITFVDFWNGFADEEGRFIASGPDVAGQNAQLRASDGINFTKAGQRKLAFFSQQRLDDILKTGTAEAQVAAVPPPEMLGPVQPEAPRIGPMVPIDALTSSPSGLSAVPGTETDRGAVSTTVVQRLNGDSRKTPKLRADNYLAAPVY